MSIHKKIHIGIDLDNTIIDYQDLFFMYGQKLKLIPLHDQIKERNSLKDQIRTSIDGNRKWTQLQGIVYGKHVHEAKIAKGFLLFLNECHKKNIKISIISHKSLYPVIGDKINLRAEALSWLKENKIISSKLTLNDVHFTSTIERKIELIRKLSCTHFIDDLSEVLLSPLFPLETVKIFYGRSTQLNINGVIMAHSWTRIYHYFFSDISFKKLSQNVLSLIHTKFNAESVELKHIGPNSTIYGISDTSGKQFVAKIYKRKKFDTHESMITEWNALLFLHSEGVNHIPKPLVSKSKSGISVFSFLQGDKITTVTKNEVDQLSHFLIHLDRIKKSPLSKKLPHAKESCFSISEYIRINNKRLKRLEKAGQTQESERLNTFLYSQFIPFYKKVLEYVEDFLSLKSISKYSQLTRKYQTLSPSDFGFHNCISHDKQLYFLDFEYFGWDDPAKVISDALLHPDGAIPQEFKVYFIGKMFQLYKNDSQLRDRIRMVYPLLACKWCLIILNIWTRNNFSFSDSHMKQLMKAKKYLFQIKKEFNTKSFPYTI